MSKVSTNAARSFIRCAAMRRPVLDLTTGEVFLDLEALRLAMPGAFLVPVSWDDPEFNPADPATWVGYMEAHHG